jgi:hypothetical protein
LPGLVLGEHVKGLTACNNRGRIFPHVFRHWISPTKGAVMKKTWIWWLVGLISLGSAGRSLAQETRSTEEAVVRLEQQWFEARKSCEQLAPLMSDKVLITESDGKVTSKAEALESCKNTKWSLIRIKEMNLTIFGDTVIATGEGSLRL